MKRRFRRRRHAEESPDGITAVRSPFNLIWVISAVIVLASVIFYDRSQVHQARHHVDQARDYEKHGLYAEALKEYRLAYANKRLGRKLKGEVAMAIGDIYFDRYENYDMAYNHYVDAKRDNPRLFEGEAAHNKLKTAMQRSAGAGGNRPESSDSTTETLVQRVQLISPPQEDLRGPVVARYKGGEIHAGEFLRWVKAQPQFSDPQFRDDPRRLEDALKQYLPRVMRYQAAVDANIHRDPDLSTRLYDYQRTLIAERYATELRQKATLVDPKAVQDYYDKNRSRYVQPAGAMIALIKTNTESEAQQALERLRKGDSFADVATSASIDEASAKNGGVVGMISDGDTSIPAVGKAPQIIKSLVAMQPRSISSIVSQNGSFFIFQVLRTAPARNITLDEARPQIEMTLRGANVDAANTGIDANLREKYDPEVGLEGLQKFWQFAAGEPNRDNANTTTSTAVTHTTQTAALAQRGK